MPEVLTTRQLDAWTRNPPAARRSVFDAVERGLEARLGRRGVRWALQIRPPGASRAVRVDLGAYPEVGLAEARQKAAAERKRLSSGLVSPHRAPTVERCAEAWLDRLRASRSAAYADEAARALRRDLGPELRGLRADRLTRAHVRRLLRDVAARAPVIANRLQAYLSAMLSWAMEQEDLLLGRVHLNPLLRMPRQAGESPRTRVLSWPEIRAVWAVAIEIDSPAAIAHLVALATMQRRFAVLGGRWSEVDEPSGWWDIPGERMKGWPVTEAHGVTLEPALFELLRRSSAGGVLFPSRATAESIVDAKKTTQTIQRRSGTTEWTFHDLRTTAASRALELGADELAIQRTLGHRRRGALRHYIHVVRQPAVRGVLSAWQRHLLAEAGPTK